MKYLLIDFGASYIKSTVYDTASDQYNNYTVTESPLQFCNFISKEYIIQELTKIGITANRFNAIKMDNGAIGCSMSHLKILQNALAFHELRVYEHN